MLSAKNLKQKKSSKKLLNKMIKFFHIQKLINKQTYHFNLSIIYRVHFIFHVFLLKLYNHRLNNDFIFDYLVLRLIASSRVLDSKSIKLSWNFFEKVLSWVEKLNSRTRVELRSLTRQFNSTTRLNSTRY